jgi:carbamate kinase
MQGTPVNVRGAGVIAMKRPPLLVVALGGNAMQDPAGDDSVPADFDRTMKTARTIGGLAASGEWRLVVTHGNGPQVGNHLLRSELAHEHGHLPPLPLDVCVADTQGGLGYMLQQSLVNALHEAGAPAVVASVVTQVVVDEDDPAFSEPSKPVGEMIDDERVEDLRRRGWALAKDPHRGGWRRVVASPDPKEIVEAGAVASLVEDGVIVIAGGGGGIPVVQGGDGILGGVSAVVDKDLASALLAADLGADAFLILTDVDRAFVRFGTPEQEEIERMSVADARSYLDAGEFPPGSMGPKVEAVCRFVAGTGGRGVITSIANARAGLRGEAGTTITVD